MGKEPGDGEGKGMITWLFRFIQFGIPLLWVLTLVLGGFSTVIEEINTPQRGLPATETELPNMVIPIPLSLFAIGFFLFLGPVIMIWDGYVLLKWLEKRSTPY